MKLTPSRMIWPIALSMGIFSGCATYEKCGTKAAQATGKSRQRWRPSVIITAANRAEQVKGVSRVENTIVVSQ